MVGVWWLLREIECAALTIASVSNALGGGPVVLHLGATKTDIQGRGVSRAHRCLCEVSPQWARICPACTLRSQWRMRCEQSADMEAPLFPAPDNQRTQKRHTVDAMREVFQSEIDGVTVDGHSLRRTGAQLMAASGLPPWNVEWFGRWGSSAIRAYIEDARARAPESSTLALQVAAVASQALEPRAQNTQLVACRDSTAEQPQPAAAEIARAARDGAGDKFVEVYLSGARAHLAREVVALGSRGGRVALCGWNFGQLPARRLTTSTFDKEKVPDDLCRKCRRSACVLGVLPDESVDDSEEVGSSSGQPSGTDSAGDSP